MDRELMAKHLLSMKKTQNFNYFFVFIFMFLLLLGPSQIVAAVNHVEIQFESGTYVSIPFDLDFGEIKFPNIEMQLIDNTNTVVPIEEHMVFEYFHETVVIKENGEANINISIKIIFETFYETELYNLSKLGEKSHIEIGDLGASPIHIGSLRLYQGDIRIRSATPGTIKEIKRVSARYENKSKGFIQTQNKKEAGMESMFHILLTENLTHLKINDTVIFLDISYDVEDSLTDSFYSNDMKKQEMQIRNVPECYIFSMTLDIKLPEKIRLIRADNLQGSGNELFFSQKLVTPNDIKTFNIEYLRYLSDWERILNDLWVNLSWAIVGGLLGMLFGVLIGVKRKNKTKQPKTKKEEVIREFKSLEGISKVKAERLYESGFDSFEKLKEASADDLKDVKGIGKKLADDIKKQLREKSYPLN